MFFLIIMISSSGMFFAAVAYLPSSFAMNMGMLGLADFMNWRGGLKTAQGIMWFGIGAIIGWPFAGALVMPFLFEEVVLAVWTKDTVIGIFYRFLDGAVRCLIVLVSFIGSRVNLASWLTAEGLRYRSQSFFLSQARGCLMEDCILQRL